MLSRFRNWLMAPVDVKATLTVAMCCSVALVVLVIVAGLYSCVVS